MNSINGFFFCKKRKLFFGPFCTLMKKMGSLRHALQKKTISSTISLQLLKGNNLPNLQFLLSKFIQFSLVFFYIKQLINNILIKLTHPRTIAPTISSDECILPQTC